MFESQENVQINSGYLPSFFELKISSQRKAFESLISKNSNLQICDQIESQIRELIKIRNPQQKLTEEEVKREIELLVDNKPIDEYGTWVYYPWSNKIVHLLSAKEFIELRTSRNLYKITPEERDLLQTKTIGIIGLSVGQSIALTLAMERVCSELRLADFDVIELSNMNRIRTSVSNIGISKVVVAAREILELDPYLKVICYTDGITESNIDDFFSKEKKIDLLVEECDGLDIKILSRIKARELRVPILMDTNDRGMLDIERYDLEPNRELLHGLIPAGITNLEALKDLSNQEKVPMLGAMVGIESISERMKLSLSEMGKTITTWPQLASSVVLGGAMVTDTARRLLLNQITVSGRFYVDFEDIIK